MFPSELNSSKSETRDEGGRLHPWIRRSTILSSCTVLEVGLLLGIGSDKENGPFVWEGVGGRGLAGTFSAGWLSRLLDLCHGDIVRHF